MLNGLPFDHPSTLVRWRFGWLTVQYADGCRGVFSCWEAALLTLVEEERVKIR